jgi:predicted transcriptional regulator
MKISEVVDKTGLEALNGWEDEDLAGVYISDMVSDIITGANDCGLLLTLQTHKSLIAAANLVDVAAVVFAHGKRPADDVIQLADKAGIALFTTPTDTWSYALKLFELGMR